MKITKVLQPAVMEEVEITLPFYRSSSDLFYFKGVDEKNIIQISISKSRWVLRVEKFDYAPSACFEDGSKEITEQEFDAKFNEVIAELTNVKNN